MRFEIIILTVLFIYSEAHTFETEDHEIITEDGYILNTVRIVSKRNNSKPVLMVPGAFQSSDLMFVLGNRSLCELLFEKGYDIWLMNPRGTSYSRKHQTLDPDLDIEFWKYSWHEIGYYDLASNIDYILNTTKKTKLDIIAHSQGGTAHAILLSLKPEYNDKVNGAVLWAPAVLANYVYENSVFSKTAKWEKQIKFFVNTFGSYEILPFQMHRRLDLGYWCSLSSITRLFFTVMLNIVANSPSIFSDQEYTCEAAASVGGGSIVIFLHFFQNMNFQEFAMYDYGSSQNLLKFGQELPPVYNISSTVPTLVIHCEDDHLAPQESIYYLRDQLANVTLHMIEDSLFTHADFVIHNNALSFVYEPTCEFLERLHSNQVKVGIF